MDNPSLTSKGISPLEQILFRTISTLQTICTTSTQEARREYELFAFPQIDQATTELRQFQSTIGELTTEQAQSTLTLMDAVSVSLNYIEKLLKYSDELEINLFQAATSRFFQTFNSVKSELRFYA